MIKLFSGKTDRSHRVKTYMLVTAYQGFRVCGLPLLNNQETKLLERISFECCGSKINAM